MSDVPRRDPVQRHSCARCDGEIFLLSSSGRVVCAGCRATARDLRVVREPAATPEYAAPRPPDPPAPPR